MFLSLVDLDFQPSAPADWTLDVETTCLNRDLPQRLPFGGGQPYLQLARGGPIAARRLPDRAHAHACGRRLRQGTVWRLISHLSLNHLSLADIEDGAEALREILRLYDFGDSAETRAMIEGLLSVRSRRVVGRVGGSVSAGFCRGLEVTLQLDEDTIHRRRRVPVRQRPGAFPGPVHFPQLVHQDRRRHEPNARSHCANGHPERANKCCCEPTAGGEPYRFEFFQAVRVWDAGPSRAGRGRARRTRGRRRTTARRSRETCGSAALPSHTFPPSEVAALTAPRPAEPTAHARWPR